MITELGHFCLILAMLVAFLQCVVPFVGCLLYTSDAADDTPCVDLGGRRIIKKKT